MQDVYVSLSLTEPDLRHRATRALLAAGIEPVGDVPAAALHIVDGASRPSSRQVVVVEAASRRETAELLDAGVEGIVLAATLDHALVPTIRAVLAGQVVVPHAVRNAVRRPMLSPREKRILGMVVMGFTNQEIAARLHLAPSTVKSHLRTMFTELGVRSRKEAADLVLDPSAGLGTGILTIAPREDDEPAEGA